MVGVLADPALYGVIGGDPPSRATLRERYELQARGRAADGTETWHNWIVRLRADRGRAIGFVQATIVGEGGSSTADVAWLVGVPWQGRGYATEAARAIVDWLLASGVATITAHVAPAHRPSELVAERVGLARTDVVEDGERVWRRDR